MDRLSAPLPYPSFKLPWGHVLDEICSLATSMLRLLVLGSAKRLECGILTSLLQCQEHCHLALDKIAGSIEPHWARAL